MLAIHYPLFCHEATNCSLVADLSSELDCELRGKIRQASSSPVVVRVPPKKSCPTIPPLSSAASQSQARESGVEGGIWRICINWRERLKSGGENFPSSSDRLVSSLEYRRVIYRHPPSSSSECNKNAAYSDFPEVHLKKRGEWRGRLKPDTLLKS